MMIKQFFVGIIIISATFLLTACNQETPSVPISQEPAQSAELPTPTNIPPEATTAPAPETQLSDMATLEIINVMNIDICDISITPIEQTELNNNLLAEPLTPNASLTHTKFEAGRYNLLAFSCDYAMETPAAEEIDILLGETAVVWQIGKAVKQPDTGTVVSPPPIDHKASYNPDQCPFDVPTNVNVDCGYLTVTENRTKTDSPDIKLAVAILRVPEADRLPDPIIYLAGGPGGSALDDLYNEIEGWTEYPFSRNRDLIFIDQRGTGYSSPTLNCTEMDSEDYAGDDPELDCRDRLKAEGIDLTAYNSAENAADIAALAATLNYDSWNLLGVSYGTRLALTIIRDHPQGIRSVVLDSSFPPNANTPVEEGVLTMELFRKLFAACAADTACNEAYPDLEAILIETVARLNETPEGDIYGDDLVMAIQEIMTAGEDIPLIPRLIYDFSKNDFALFNELVTVADGGVFTRFQGGGADVSDSEGMFNSVICHDEFLGGFHEAGKQAEAHIPPELQPALFGDTASMFELCTAWGSGFASELENQAVVSDIPTLILQGEYDAATPPVWGRLTAKTLSNSFYFEFPGKGHSLLSGIPCAISITSDFLDNPTTEPDRSCLNDMPPLVFELP